MRLTSLLLGVAFAFSNFQANANLATPAHTQIQQKTGQHLTYKIADIDPRFGLSQDQLIQISQQAADIWKQGTGQDYFTYDPNAKLEIRLVYDNSQSRSEQRQKIAAQFQQEQQRVIDEQQQIKQLKQTLGQTQSELENKKQILNGKLKNLDQLMMELNQGKLAPEYSAKSLAKTQKDLQKQTVALKKEIAAYNQQAKDLNVKVTHFNQINNEFNNSLNQFKQNAQADVFKKGIYNGKQIVIYEFKSIDDLRLTIAHELGHALGLKHSDQPNALMYSVRKDGDKKITGITDADRDLLSALPQ
ncbi:matrixin family metalloprotease [Acinetobacter pittii]|nr:M57 family metalloprotease [Acinetobacter pittii]MCE6238228.1 matrixin family metalloprotease [Acinetobacter pittii]MCE6692980.1 matrixin family metalloprotease [Acinetobacter pittii]MCE6700484.1 matrixin family metalloprotease [Acinetobacter pittii]MCH2073156.1 M57 family metalloprotease [Acinetobacter pittii]MCU4528372.1 matrixin family metalloprotease [Acinetobacter pittii]